MVEVSDWLELWVRLECDYLRNFQEVRVVKLRNSKFENLVVQEGCDITKNPRGIATMRCGA